MNEVVSWIQKISEQRVDCDCGGKGLVRLTIMGPMIRVSVCCNKCQKRVTRYELIELISTSIIPLEMIDNIIDYAKTVFIKEDADYGEEICDT